MIWKVSARFTGVAILGLSLAVQCGAQIAPAAPAPHVVKVVGEGYKLVLLSDGTVVGWGDARDGQLGPIAAIPTRRGQSIGLVAIQLPGKAVDIAARNSTSYAALDDGTVVAWGKGSKGALGTGSPAAGMAETPIRVKGLSNVTQVAATEAGALALLRDGTVFAWGTRGRGVIGDGQHPKRHMEEGAPALEPVRVPRVSNITQLATGDAHVLALTADGRVLTWGSNYYGALGREPRQELPMDAAAEVPGLTGVIAVAGGIGVSTALRKDGTVWVWGANWHGQFGNGDRTDPPGVGSGYQLVPQQVQGVSNVVAISLGITGRHTLALLKDGTLRGWGNTDWGQLGAGVSGDFQLKPVVPKLTGVKAVFAAGNHSFAVRTDNTLWIWGSGARNEWPLTANAKLPVRLELK